MRPRGATFLPNDLAVAPNALWVATQWCALARVDQSLGRMVAPVRLPCDAYQTMAVGAGAIWVSESLAGVYRIDAATNRVAARIHVESPTGPLVANRFLFGGGSVLVVGSWTRFGALTRRNGLARIDPSGNRASSVTPLPPGPLAVAFGESSLWVGQAGGSQVLRLDPRTGKIISRLRADIGTALAVAAGRLWTTGRHGTIHSIAIP
jgi:hypothetical protein